MDYTSPKQAHSSNSKLSSPPPPIIGENHQSRTTTSLIITQALGGPNVPSPEPITAMALPGSTNLGPVARYRECQKNHAASTGGHVLDGCGEFMPASSDGDSPEALKCAACECHRSFHRKETDENPNHNSTNYNNVARENVVRGNSTASAQAVLLPHQHYFNPQIRHQYNNHHHRLSQPVMMAFGGAESSSEDLNALNCHSGQANNGNTSGSKKRFRTKFKDGQKERMTEFAEKLGWRIQKHDEDEVQRFCSEVGVKRQVFKVWMHNNKQAMKKKDGNSDINGNGDHHQSDVKPIT